MDQKIRPVDVISVCAADGSIRPLRFRMEDTAAGFIRVDISRVISCRQIQYVGIEAYVFLCEAWVKEKRQLLELRYTIRSHTWCLLGVVN